MLVSSVTVAGRVSQLRTVFCFEHDATCSDPLEAIVVHVCGPPGCAHVYPLLQSVPELKCSHKATLRGTASYHPLIILYRKLKIKVTRLGTRRGTRLFVALRAFERGGVEAPAIHSIFGGERRLSRWPAVCIVEHALLRGSVRLSSTRQGISTYSVVLIIPARLALPGLRACRAIGDWHGTSIRVLPLCCESAQVCSCARHGGRRIRFFMGVKDCEEIFRTRNGER